VSHAFLACTSTPFIRLGMCVDRLCMSKSAWESQSHTSGPRVCVRVCVNGSYPKDLCKAREDDPTRGNTPFLTACAKADPNIKYVSLKRGLAICHCIHTKYPESLAEIVLVVWATCWVGGWRHRLLQSARAMRGGGQRCTRLFEWVPRRWSTLFSRFDPVVI
jgi:hypothetical protein